MAATFTKLKTGKWGVRVNFNACTGMVIDVTKKSGSATSVRLGRMIHSKGGVSIFEIKRPENNGYDVPKFPRYSTCAQCGCKTDSTKLGLDIHGMKGRVCQECAKLAPADRSFG